MKNSGNLGGVKAQETKTNFKRETREGKKYSGNLGVRKSAGDKLNSMKTVSSITKMIVDLYIFSSLSSLCPGHVGAEYCLRTQDVLCFEALEKNT